MRFLISSLEFRLGASQSYFSSGARVSVSCVGRIGAVGKEGGATEQPPGDDEIKSRRQKAVNDELEGRARKEDRDGLRSGVDEEQTQEPNREVKDVLGFHVRLFGSCEPV